MAEEITRLESPIDAMHLIHKALRAEALRMETMVAHMEMGESLQTFRSAFNLWASMLVYHAEKEDEELMAPLMHCPAARDGVDAHRTIEERLEDVQTCMNEEIGKTRLIARTQRHLYGRVIAARITQDDHLEEEEEFILPLVREQIDEQKQAEIMKHLLIDEDAEDKRWVLNWVSRALTPTECSLLGELVDSAVS